MFPEYLEPWLNSTIAWLELGFLLLVLLLTLLAVGYKTVFFRSDTPFAVITR